MKAGFVIEAGAWPLGTEFDAYSYDSFHRQLMMQQSLMQKIARIWQLAWPAQVVGLIGETKLQRCFGI
jgi:hypothetical protein